MELSSTAGVVALAAAGCALAALLATAVLAVRLRRLRAAQRVILGEEGSRDVVEHARLLEREVAGLSERLEGIVEELGARAEQAHRRLDGAITHAAVVRYDAYNEMSGMQSSSVALLDDRRNGVVLSSILHREQARLYVKPVVAGRSELGLSPEEEAAVEDALSAPAESPPAPR